MATVTGYTAARMQAIEDGTIVDGTIVNGDLILTTHNGTEINAGSVYPAPAALFLKDRIYFGRAKTGDPGHIASKNLAGGDFQIEAWSVDPTKWIQWFKPSPDGSKALVMRLADSVVVGAGGTPIYDDITQSTLEIYDGATSGWSTVMGIPSSLTNPDGSSISGQGTFHWLERPNGDDVIIGFRGPIRTGGANAIAVWDTQGNLLDIVADVTGVSFTDPAPSPLWAARHVPVVSSGFDANLLPITATGTNGSTNLTSAALFTVAMSGKFVYGPGITPGTYATYVNASSMTLSAAAGAGAGTGTHYFFPMTTSVISTASFDVGMPMIASPVGADQEIFAFPLAQPHQDAFPKGYYQFTENTATALKDYDPLWFPDGTGLAILTKDTTVSGMICGIRADQGVSGDGTKPRMWFGHTTTERGAPDIVDDAGNYISRPSMLPHLQANGKWLVSSYRYYASGHQMSYDTGAPATAVSVVAFDVDPRTFVAANPRTIHVDDHICFNVEVV